jgi:FkbM family methyltransferase
MGASKTPVSATRTERTTRGAIRVARHVQRTIAEHPAWLSPLHYLSRCGMVPGFLWRKLHVACDIEMLLPGGHTVRYRSHAGDAIGRQLYWQGPLAFEPETTRVFLALAPSARVLLDVGANTGWFALLCCAANPRCRAYCFEPVPRIFEALKTNVAINHFEDRCTPIMAAVAEHDGRAQFHVPYCDFPTSACLDPRGFRNNEGELIDSEVLALDSFLDAQTPVDLVKLDTEGFEDKALMGMLDIVGRYAPDVIVECNPDGPYRSIQRLLGQSGYRFFHLLDTGATERSTIEPDADECFRNYLCTARQSTLDCISAFSTCLEDRTPLQPAPFGLAAQEVAGIAGHDPVAA